MSIHIREIFDIDYDKEFNSVIYVVNIDYAPNLVMEVYNFEGQWYARFQTKVGKYRNLKGLGKYLVIDREDKTDHSEVFLLDDWLEKTLS